MLSGFPGGMPGGMPPGGIPAGVVAAAGGPGSAAVSQLAFTGPQGLRVSWDTSGQGFFDSEPLVAPGRQNFSQGAIYRVKLTNVPGRPGEEYYPTVEVAPRTPRTEAYLAHNAVPIQFTATDFDQVQSGNFVTKVIYLPDPEYQELALAAIETLVSTRLDPGVDPIREADRRGSILAIIRLGNKDLNLPSPMPEDVGAVQPVSFESGVAETDAPGQLVGGMISGPAVGNTGLPSPHPTMGLSPAHVAGVTAPQYGMPMSGTPIGLPGPPHVPLGIPAGLQKHVIQNKTRVQMPQPTKKMHIGVEQKPGYSYPKPPNRVQIVEEASRDKHGPVRQPVWDMFQWIKH